MKKTLSILLSASLVLACMFGCSLLPNFQDDAQQTSPKNLASSGTVWVPASIQELKLLLQKEVEKAPEDPFFMDIREQLSALAGVRSPDHLTTLLSRDLVGSLFKQLEELQQAIDSFLITKKIDRTLDLSDEKFGSYINLQKAKMTIKAHATTTDANPLQEDLSNLDTGQGEYSLQVHLEPVSTHMLSSSMIRDFDVRIATNTEGSLWRPSHGQDRYLTLKERYDIQVGTSLNIDDMGGKVLIQLSLASSRTSTLEEFAYLDFANPDVFNMKIEFYDDSNTLRFTRTYTSLTALLSDFDLTPESPGI